eukprot:1765931-Prymnesium_polylepis.1
MAMVERRSSVQDTGSTRRRAARCWSAAAYLYDCNYVPHRPSPSIAHRTAVSQRFRRHAMR